MINAPSIPELISTESLSATQLSLEIVTPSSNFGRFAVESNCFFALPALKSGRLHAIRWDKDISLSEGLELLIPIFIEYIIKLKSDISNRILYSDSLVLEFDGYQYGGSINNTGMLLNKLLRGISSSDPAGANCMDKSLDDPKWKFEFLGEEIFFLVFAPFYPSNHPRSTGSINSVFISIQPDISFTYRMNGVGGREKFNEVKLKIRDRFESAGVGYAGMTYKDTPDSSEQKKIITGPHQAYRVLKPINSGDVITRWWDMN